MSNREEGVNNSTPHPQEAPTSGQPGQGDAGRETPHALWQRLLAEGRFKPEAALHWLIHAHRYSQLIHAMARLDLARLLRDTPLPTSVLAEASGIADAPLRRLLRGLCWCGALSEPSTDTWALSPLGRALCPSDGQAAQPAPLHDAAMHAGTYLYPAWGALPQGLLDGRIPFEVAFGRRFFEEMTEDADGGARFDRIMNQVARGTAEGLLATGVFESAERIVDVGGGNGEFLALILAAIPTASGIVFDQARLEAACEATILRHGCAERASFHAGDFFTSVVAGGDVYVLQRVLHDWEDADCVRILQRVVAAATTGARVLVVEELLPEGPVGPEDHAVAIDLAMLVATGGRERSAADYEAMATQAGLASTGRRQAAHGLWLLEFRV